MTPGPVGDARWDGVDLWGSQKQFRDTLSEAEEAEFDDYLDGAREADLEERRAELEGELPEVDLDQPIPDDQFDNLPEADLDQVVDWQSDRDALKEVRERSARDAEFADTMAGAATPDRPPIPEDTEPIMASAPDTPMILVDGSDPDAPTPADFADAVASLRAAEATRPPLDVEGLAAAVQDLAQIEADLVALIGSLDAGADLRQELHTTQVEGALITDANLVRIKIAEGLQRYLIKLGGLILDITAIAGALKDRKNFDGLASLENIDKLYELAKTFESGINTLRTTWGTDEDQIKAFNDTAGWVGTADEFYSDDPRLAIQTLKSHASDVSALIKEAIEKGRAGDFRETMRSLSVRVLKSMAAAQLKLTELRRGVLEQTLAVEQLPFAASQADWMLFSSTKFEAIDALASVRSQLHELQDAGAARASGVLLYELVPAESTPVLDPAAALSAVLEDRPSLTAEDVLAAADPIFGDTMPSGQAVRADIDATEAAIASTKAQVTRVGELQHGLGDLQIQQEVLEEQQVGVTNTLSNLSRHEIVLDLGIFDIPLQGDDVAVREAQAEHRRLTSAIVNVEDERRALEAQLAEIPVLDARLDTLGARLDRLAPRLTEAYDASSKTASSWDEDFSWDEDDAPADRDPDDNYISADLEPDTEAADSFFSGRWLIAGAIVAMIVGALLATSLLRGNDATDDTPASSSDAQAAGTTSDQPAPSTEARTPDGTIASELLGDFVWYGDGVINFAVEGDRIVGRVARPGTHSSLNFLVGINVICPEFVSDVVFDLDLTGNGEWFWYKNQPCERLGGAEVTVEFLERGASARGQKPASHPSFEGVPQGHTMLRVAN